MLIIEDDTVWGTTAISAYIGLPQVKTFRWLTAGKLPGRLIANRWTARKGELDRWLAAQRQTVAA